MIFTLRPAPARNFAHRDFHPKTTKRPDTSFKKAPKQVIWFKPSKAHKGAHKPAPCSCCCRCRCCCCCCCCCIKPWIGCSVHFQEGLKCSNPKKPRSTATKRSPDAELEAKKKMRKTVGQLFENSGRSQKPRTEAAGAKSAEGMCPRREGKTRSLQTKGW